MAGPTAEEEQGHKEAVERDRAYVQKKFFPQRKRAVRHAGYQWSNPMSEDLRETVQDMLPNDTGLPSASISAASNSIEGWCKKTSWGLCKHCASVQPQHLKENVLHRPGSDSLMRCKNCAKPEAKQAWIPQPEDVPEPLRGLNRLELQALRPLDIDCGPTWKAEYGYYFHSAMIRFSWAGTDVEDKIQALERRSRKRAKKAGGIIIVSSGLVNVPARKPHRPLNSSSRMKPATTSTGSAGTGASFGPTQQPPRSAASGHCGLWKSKASRQQYGRICIGTSACVKRAVAWPTYGARAALEEHSEPMIWIRTQKSRRWRMAVADRA